jgi:integrase
VGWDGANGILLSDATGTHIRTTRDALMKGADDLCWSPRHDAAFDVVQKLRKLRATQTKMKEGAGLQSDPRTTSELPPPKRRGRDNRGYTLAQSYLKPDITIAEATAQWLESILDRNLREASVHNLGRLVCYLTETYGSRVLSSFHWQEIIDLANARHRDTADSTLTFFRWAALRYNVPDTILQFKWEQRAKEDKKIRFLSASDAQKFYDAIRDPYKAAFACALYAGIRPYECMRLRWGDLDFDRRIVYISAPTSKTHEPRQIECERRTWWQIKLMNIDIPKEAIPGLPKLLWELLLPLRGAPCEHIFPRPAEYAQRPEHTTYKIWKRERGRAIRASGVSLSHDVLRHTCLTYLVALYGSHGIVARLAGNTERILKSHYLGITTRSEAEMFFRREPTEESHQEVFVVPFEFSDLFPDAKLPQIIDVTAAPELPSSG